MPLIPRETKFFDMFAELAGYVTDGARLLYNLFNKYENVEERIRQLKEIEHRADETTHAIMTKLNSTFITPLDREDIHKLASVMDDVLDYVNSAGSKLITFGVKQPPPSAAELALIIVRQTEQIAEAVSKLEKADQAMSYCVEINRLEDEADTICRSALRDLFARETNPIELIKNKEILEALETATDKAEDVANVIESVVVKST